MKLLNILNTKSIRLTAILIVSTLFNVMAQAQEMTQIGTWDVHHIAFPSTFIQPETAKAVGLKRRNDLSLINISVLDTQTKTPLKVTVTGEARNLVGHIKNLDFVKVDEGNAIYYLGQVGYSNEETLKFTVTITDGKQTQTVKFKTKFYVD
ncbi:DUF4426 domain-containing protein [Algibacillus agarilyticus]|uniref:DUF4426 domain-containing protein n=1 Tax=Algibacillus agarilyticus TaxID=2234133 RepID=UPI000DD0E695|nr:DUF4426 domain-containing protein [Algibacillus agarilyticus]